MKKKEGSIETATLIEILILAFIQGVTEWLPISSSGHLALAQQYMRLNLPVFFDVSLHVGTLLVVIAVFRSEIFKILQAVVRLDFKSEEGKLVPLIILGSIPIAILGFVFKATFESLFENTLAVGTALLMTGFVLFISERRKNQNRVLNRLDAVLIGIAQAVALIPGVSRSGITITTGLLRKVEKQTAFTFSFLLFIPAVVGATVSTFAEAQNLTAADIDYATILIGLATTIVVGYFSLKLLRAFVLRERLHLFAYYCWALGLIVIFTQALAMS